jgi:hypothetical protein
VPASARRQFSAAATEAFLSFSLFGLFSGLAGSLLAGPLHDGSPALVGAALFVTFGSGAVVQTTTTNWSVGRLLASGIATILAGLGVLVLSCWTSPPSLALFLIGGAVAGAGGGGRSSEPA